MSLISLAFFLRIRAHLKFIRRLFSSNSLMHDCFIRKQILHLNEQYQLVSSIVDLKQIRVRVFLEGNIFHGVVTNETMNSWARFTRNAIILYYPFLFIEKLTFPSSISFSINMEGSKRTTTGIGHLSSSTENKQKKQKRCNLMTESLLSNNRPNCFQFTVTPTHEKTCGLRRKNGTIILPSRQPRTVDNIHL